MPGRGAVIGIVIASFFLGVGAGWFTWILPRVLVAGDPSPSTTAAPSPAPTEGPVVPVELYPPIERPLANDDIAAGLTDLGVTAAGTGSLTLVPGVVEPPGSGRVRWVRIEIEDGLPLAPEALSTFVMDALNDERGWGADGLLSFGRTDGAADVRIVFAHPLTVDSMCADPHAAKDLEVEPPQVTVTGSPSVPSPTMDVAASPEPSATPVMQTCADQGMVIINAYQWADGLESFVDDRPGARRYLLMHFLGHFLGEDDAVCEGTDVPASVMVDHEMPIAPCTPNSWPHAAST